MKIKQAKIHNWRSIADITVDFEDIMIFIGQNNHGKSNILSALLFFFGEINVNEGDYRKGSNDLWVEIEFEELDEHDRNQFKKYLTSDNTIRVRKTANLESGILYQGYTQIPENDLLNESVCTEYTSRDKAKKLPFYNLLPQSGRITKTNISEALQQYLSENSKSLKFEYKLEATNFLGAKNIALGIFGTVLFVPAVKNSSDELSTRGASTFNKLLSRVINEMSEGNEKYKEARKKISELTQVLNKQLEDGSENTERPEQLTSLEQKIEQQLSVWNTKIDIEIIPPNIDEIFRLGTQVWVDDGVKTDINHKGQGLQRSMIFALVRSWVDVIKEGSEKVKDKSGRKASDSTFLILEEPELYLHPQAQREFFEVLKTISEGKNQVMMSTHSSYFLDLSLYKSICIVKKECSTSPTVCFQCIEDLFKDVDEKKVLNLSYWINPDRGELFFSEKVILVEGQTDKTLIPFLADKLGIFKHSYTIIDCASKDNIPLYLQLLNKFKIKHVAVYDKDNQSYKDKSAKDCANKSTQLIENAIDTALGESVVFENDIEEEIGLTDKNSKNKPYKALEKVNTKSFVMTDSLKNKINLIYK